ncbi:MAG: hypothetical protein HW421_3512 [Ignavibacteria bacterium]|nr:hypothetical protein [Ignavibacteria bacterium]
MKKFCSIIILLLIAYGSLYAGYDMVNQQRDGKNINSFSIQGSPGFTENKGQIINQYNEAVPEILYLYNGPGFKIHLKSSGFSYELYSVKYDSSRLIPVNQISTVDGIDLQPRTRAYREIHSHRVDVSFVGANPHAQLNGSDKSEDYENYFTVADISSEGIHHVYRYGRVYYKDIYPGIDAEFYLDNNSLGDDGSISKDSKIVKYNFIVHPGGNISDIKLRYEGADDISIDAQGILTIKTSEGNITERIPIAFVYDETSNSDKQEVKIDFNLNNNVITFTTKRIAPGKTLVIDPEVTWARYFGGALLDDAYDVTKDGSNNIIIVGNTLSTSNIATTGYHQTVYGGGTTTGDAYLAKFNSSNGTKQWSTYYGGTGEEIGIGVAVDASDNIYMVGSTSTPSTETGVISSTLSHQVNYGGSTSDGFVVKFSNAGVRQWGTYYGGSGPEWCSGVIVEGSNLYFAGTTQSSQSISTSGSYLSSYQLNTDGFLVKMNTDGTRLWGTYYGTANVEFIGFAQSTHLGIDASNNVYISGVTNHTSSSTLSTPGAHQTTNGGAAGTYDCFIAKFASDGTRPWATYYGGNGNDNSSNTPSVAIDASNNIYLAGTTTSSNGTSIATANSHQSVFGSNSDAFLAKFNSSGVRQWGTYLGGTNTDKLFGITIDNSNNPIIFGSTLSTSGIASTGTYQTSKAGGATTTDAFLVKFNSSGVRQWGSYIGLTASDNETNGSITAIDGASCNIVVIGQTNSANFQFYPSNIQGNQYGSNKDAYIAKFIGNLLRTEQFASNMWCTGDTITVTYSTFNSFNSDNIFKVQLSNNDFATSTTLTSFSGTVSGSNTFIVPSVSPSTLYRVRVISSSPLMTSSSDGVHDNGQNISIFTNPSPGITGPGISNGTYACANTLAEYSVTDNTQNLRHRWSVIGGTITSSSNTNTDIQIFWQGTGSGTLSLRDSVNLSCYSDVSYTITKNPLPIPEVTGTNAFCPGSNLTYTATYANPATWFNSWTIIPSSKGSILGSTTGSSAYVNWGTSPGTATVSLTHTDNITGCNSTTFYQVTINPAPAPWINGSTSVCPNVSFSYSNTWTGSPTPTPNTMTWTVSGGGTIVGLNTANPVTVIYQPNTSPLLSVEQTITSTGCTFTDTKIITVNPLPTPYVSGNTSVCAFATESYSSTFSGSCTWSAIGGAIAQPNINPTQVLWSSPGSGTVTVVQGQGSCRDSAVKAITINPLPSPGISGVTAVCESNYYFYSSTFNDPSISNSWTVDNGSTTTTTGNGIWVLWTPGTTTGKVYLTQTNTLTGCTKTTNINISKNLLPQPHILGLTSVCANNNLDYSTDLLINGLSCTWSVTGGSITGSRNSESVNILWGTSSSGTLSLIQTNSSGCLDSSYRDITINSLPPTGVSGNSQVCANNSEPYSATYTTTIATYQWNVNGGSITSGAGTSGITVRWGNVVSPTSGTVTLTQTSNPGAGGCQNSYSKTITINPLSNPGIAGNTSQVCAFTSEVYSSTINPVGTSNSWTVVGGSGTVSGNSNSYTVAWGSAATGSIKLVQTIDATGCKDSLERTITINALPTPGISGNTTICANNTTTYYYTNSVLPGTSSLWSVSNGAILGNNTGSTITVLWGDVVGSGTVTLIQTNSANCSNSASLQIMINPLPTPTITGQTTVCSSNTYTYSASTSTLTITNSWAVSGNGSIIGGTTSNTAIVNWTNLTTSPATCSITLIQTITATGCSNSYTQPVTINPVPVPDITGNTSVCASSTVNYQSNSSSNSNSWSVTGGSLLTASTGNSVTVLWGTGSTGTIKLIQMINATGCTDSITKNITINALPVPTISGLTSVCSQNTYIYTATSAAGGNTYLWSVTGGTITTSTTGSSISVTWGTFTTSSTVTVTLTQTNTSGCSSTTSSVITINPLPEPSIDGSTSICQNNIATYTYTATSPPGPDNLWRVTGGVIIGNSTGTTINVQWGGNPSGVVVLTQTISPTQCKDSFNLNVNINPLPSPGISGATASCAGLPVTYSSTITPSGTSNTWTVTNGTISGSSTGTNVTVLWNNSGSTSSGTVTLVQTINATGCKDSTFMVTTISPLPSPGISGNTNVCEESIEPYSATFNSGVTHNWYVSGGSIMGSATTPTINIYWQPYSGTFGTVKLVQTLSGTGCKDSVTINVTINTKPVTTITGTTNVCVNSTDSYSSSTATLPLTNLWSVTGGSILNSTTGATINILWNTAGSQVVTLIQTYTASGCKDTATRNVNVNLLPSVGITGPAAVCAFNTTGYSTSGTNVNYQWSVTGGSIAGLSNTNSISVNWGSAGSGNVSVVQTSTIVPFCQNSASISVSINNLPSPSISGQTTTCISNLYNYSTTTTTPVGITNQWTVSSGGAIQGLSTGDAISVLWTGTGTKTVKLLQSISSSSCNDSLIRTITVNPLPTPNITGSTEVCASNTTIYSTTFSAASAYLWVATGGSIIGSSTGTTINVTWGNAGNGSIKLYETITATGCHDSSTKNITIYALPIVTISGNSSVCELSDVPYSTATSGSAYLWSVVGGSIQTSSTGNSISVHWGNAGSGTVTLRVTVGYGATSCSDSFKLPITINPLPNPTINGNTSVCEQNLSIYSTTVSANIVNSWTANGGSITTSPTANTITILWGGGGTGSVVLLQTNTSTNCSKSFSLAVTINPKPSVNINGPGVVCASNSFTYNATTPPNTQNQWSANNGIIIGPDFNASVNVQWNSASSGTIKLVQTFVLTGCKDSMESVININPLPQPGISGNTNVCELNDYNYTATFTQPGVNYNWVITNGSPQTVTTASSVTVRWNNSTQSPGNLKLVQSLGTGCRDSIIKSIIINPKPVPAITGSLSVCASNYENYWVPIDASKSNLWRVDGGSITTSNTANPITVLWQGAGTGIVYVTQTIITSSCVDSTNITVNINALPVPTINGNTSVCASNPQPYNTTTTGVTNVWSVTNGIITSSSTGSSIDVLWGSASSGTVKVVQTSTTPPFCKDSMFKVITINPLPTPGINGNGSVCEKNLYNYSTTITTPGGTTNLWSVTGGSITGTSTGESITVLWSSIATVGTSGSVKLVQTIGISSCKDSIIKNITINPLPVPQISGLSSVCCNNDIQYSTTPQSGVTNQWFVSNGGTIITSSTADNISINWSYTASVITSTITLIQTYTATNCRDSFKLTVTINPLPVPQISGATSVCEHNYSSFWTNPLGGTTCQWKVPNGGTITTSTTSNSITVLWGDNGLGLVRLIQTIGTTGCVDSQDVSISINRLPSPGISGNTSVCEYNDYTYSSTVTAGLSNQWSVSGGSAIGTSTGTTFDVHWDGYGNGTIKLVQTNITTLCMDSITVPITINPLPQPVINGNSAVCEFNVYDYSVNTPSGNVNNWYISPAGSGTFLTPNNGSTVQVKWGSQGNSFIRVIQTISATGCYDSNTINVQINPLPLPQIVGDTTVCEKNYETYSANTPSGTNNLWLVTGGSIDGSSVGASVNILWGVYTASPGKVKLIQTIASSSCNDSDEVSVTINRIPTPSITGNSSVCEFNSQTYTTPVVAGVSNLWVVSGGTLQTTSTGTSIVVRWGAAGNGGVRLYQTFIATSCNDSAILAITINPLPQPQITGFTLVCEKNRNDYSANPQPNVDNIWIVTGGSILNSSTAGTINVLWGPKGSGSGTITLNQRNSITGCTNSRTILITIYDIPIPTITGPTSGCSNNEDGFTTNPSANASYQWLVEGGVIQGSPNNSDVRIKWDPVLSQTIARVKIIQTLPPNNCKDSAIWDVKVNPLPKPEISGNLLVCEKNEENYSTPDNPLIKNQWYVVGGSILNNSQSSVIRVRWDVKTSSSSVKLVQKILVTNCIDSVEKPVTIYPLPIVKISGKNDVCEKNKERYTTIADQNIIFKWGVSGGTILNSSTLSAIDVLWDKAGSGTVTLTQFIAQTNCKDSSFMSITINQLPHPTISGSASVCEINIEKYSAGNPQSNIENLWSCKGGKITSSNTDWNVDVLWDTNGSGTISLIQRDKNTNCKDSTALPVKINPLPKPTITGNSEYCEDNTQLFSTTVNSDFKYLWKVEQGGSIIGSNSGSSANVSWDSTGQINKRIVKLIITLISTGCTDSTTKEVTINPIPKPKIVGILSVCEKNRNIYSADTPSGTENKWVVTGGTAITGDTGQSITIEWNSAGTGKIVLYQTIANTQCRDSAIIDNININKLPTIINGEKNTCAKNVYKYIAQTGAGTENQWFILPSGIGQISRNSQNKDTIDIQWLTSGTATITLKQKITASGCEDSISFAPITIYPLPTPSIFGKTSVCEKDIIQYYTSKPGNINNFWTAVGGTILNDRTSDTIRVKMFSAGSGTISLVQRNINTSCNDSIFIPITINKLPKPVIVRDGIPLGSNDVVYGISKKGYKAQNSSGTTCKWHFVSSINDSIIIGDSTSYAWGAIKPPNNSGTLTLTQTDNITQCTDSVKLNVLIVNAELTLKADTLAGKAGDIVWLNVTVVKTNPGDETTVIPLTTSLTFNATLLDPCSNPNCDKKGQNDKLYYTGLGNIVNNDNHLSSLYNNNLKRKLDIKFDYSVNINTGDKILSIPCRVTLGDALRTDLYIDNSLSVESGVEVVPNHGDFALIDVCMEGGPRLINALGKVDLLQPRPNPSHQSCELEFETSEVGNTQLTIVNSIGIKIATIFNGDIVPGRRIVLLNSSKLESGVYFIILQTPTLKKTVRMDVIK